LAFGPDKIGNLSNTGAGSKSVGLEVRYSKVFTDDDNDCPA
jgi:hypothetical protein